MPAGFATSDSGPVELAEAYLARIAAVVGTTFHGYAFDYEPISEHSGWLVVHASDLRETRASAEAWAGGLESAFERTPGDAHGRSSATGSGVAFGDLGGARRWKSHDHDRNPPAVSPP